MRISLLKESPFLDLVLPNNKSNLLTNHARFPCTVMIAFILISHSTIVKYLHIENVKHREKMIFMLFKLSNLHIEIVK